MEETIVVALASGGTVSLSFSVKLSELSERDRGFLLRMIDRCKEHQRRAKAKPNAEKEKPAE
jgi:hypothetical protein